LTFYDCSKPHLQHTDKTNTEIFFQAIWAHWVVLITHHPQPVSLRGDMIEVFLR